jgi:hypothetical protein
MSTLDRRHAPGLVFPHASRTTQTIGTLGPAGPSSPGRGVLLLRLALALALPTGACAQDVVAAAGGSEVKLVMHTTGITFVTSNAGSAENAL